MINVLHIDTEMTWRGGENQILQLVHGSKNLIQHHIAVRPESVAAKRFQGICSVVSLDMRGGFAPFAAWRLAKYCRQHGIKIIDAHTSNAHSLGLLIKKFVPELKLVVHRRVDYIPKSDFINRYKYMSPLVDKYVAISSAIKTILETYGIASTQVEVVRSAVDLKKYDKFDRVFEKQQLAKTFSLNPELVFLGNASAFTFQKGYDTLLKAVKILKDSNLQFHVFLAGDGELMNEMEALRADLKLEHDVTFLGFIDDVPRFLSSLDVLAISSRFEGLGTIILDATGAGLAIAATKTGGIPEIIKPGETGLLAPVDDPESLAACLTKLIDSAELRMMLQKNARRHVDNVFSLESMISGNLAVYQSLIAPTSF